MIAAALLIAACSSPPLFDMSGPACSPAQQEVACQCSECMTWDPAINTEWYEILRHNPDGTTVNVGSTASLNRAAYVDSEGTLRAAIKPVTWCYAWDVPFPRSGERYRHDVRACNQAACGPWTGTPIVYVAAPYLCGRTWCNGGPTP